MLSARYKTFPSKFRHDFILISIENTEDNAFCKLFFSFSFFCVGGYLITRHVPKLVRAEV